MLKLGEFFFKLRNYTPVPFVVYILIFIENNLDLNFIIAGTCCMILGEMIRIYGVAYIGGVSRTRTFSTGQKLITGGPFAHVRNPLYIGNLFLSGGVVIVANAGLYFNIVFFSFFFIQYIPMIRWEESNLANVFGKEFEAYLSKVPRWIPSITAKYTDSENITKDYRAAIKSEKNTLLAAITLYVLVLWRSGFFEFIQNAF